MAKQRFKDMRLNHFLPLNFINILFQTQSKNNKAKESKGKLLETWGIDNSLSSRKSNNDKKKNVIKKPPCHVLDKKTGTQVLNGLCNNSK